MRAQSRSTIYRWIAIYMGFAHNVSWYETLGVDGHNCMVVLRPKLLDVLNTNEENGRTALLGCQHSTGLSNIQQWRVERKVN